MVMAKSERPIEVTSSVQILTAAVKPIAGVTSLTDTFSVDAPSIIMAFFTFTRWGLFT